MLTVASDPRKKCLLSYVKEAYKKQSIRIRPLNRLDRETSGIVLYAKTKECFEEAIDNKKISESTKTYLAVVTGLLKFKKGEISNPLPSRQSKKIKLKAKTKFKVMREFRIYGKILASLVEAQIKSGRFHQIRKHFQMINHPLLLDYEYMDKKDFKYYRDLLKVRHFFLHCWKMELNHFVTGKPLLIVCPVPEEFKRTFKINL